MGLSRLISICLLGCFLSALPVAASYAAKGGEEKAAEQEGKAKKSSGDEEITGGRSVDDPVYVHLKPIYVPMLSTQGRSDQLISLLIDIRVQDIKEARRYQDSMPRVRDALMEGLYGGFGDGSLTAGSMVDVVGVKEKIRRSVDRVMGEGSVQEVLIQAIAQRRM